MKLKNKFLTCLLSVLLTCATAASLGAQAQTAAGGVYSAEAAEAFVIVQNEAGDTFCREATETERARIEDRSGGGPMRVIYPGAPLREQLPAGAQTFTPEGATGGQALQPSAGLRIVLHGTTQLEQNQVAKSAFIAAANHWEALISTPITVVIDVDFGPTFFGQAFGDPNILGQTGTSRLRPNPSVSDVRQALLAHSPTVSELALYSALPDSVPVEFNGATTTVSSVDLTVPLARALGFFPDISNPDSVALGRGDAGIGFNSAFPFDFNPDDGISIGLTDFDAVVTHEIGHALGFTSDAGGTSVTALSMWDLYRFRARTTGLASFATNPRLMSKGDEQVFFGNKVSTFGSTELALSTGGPNPTPTDGDGRQSSHWKDDALLSTRPFIGIMDPTISSGRRKTITENDISAIDLFGYSIGGPPIVRPPNDNFANAVTLQGASGSVTGSNVSATHEASEPIHVGSMGDKSVWYGWTAPTTGQATFDTLGSNFDTLLAVYTGSGLTTLINQAQSDNIDPSTRLSRVQFNTTAGKTYWVVVDGFDGEYGQITLNWSSTGTAPTPTPTPASFSVTGRVLDSDGSTLVNVRVALDGPTLANGSAPAPAFTNVDGVFQFTQLTGGGNYTVRPDDPRYTFSPATAVFNQISANQTGLTFIASSGPTLITGGVSENGQGLPGVTVGLFGFGPLRLLKQTTTDSGGRWSFNGVTVGQSYNVVFLKSGYTFNPPSLIFPVNQPTQDEGVVPATKTNQIEKSDFFVAQHYRDFLGREPDAAGLQFWTNEIEQCGFDTQCRQVKRINVSAAFFLSIEFQNTGYLVERMYKVAYGDFTEPSTGLVVPVIRRDEFMADTPLLTAGVVVGQGNWQTQLENNKNAYALSFVQRQRFTNAYPSGMTPTQFVTKLNQNAGGALTQAETDALAGELAANNTDAGRAAVLRKVAENAELDRREKNRAFVLMQYYGYLRRNPNDAPESNLNFAGYNFWLAKLIQFQGNFVQAEMVKAFITSSEYISRFGT